MKIKKGDQVKMISGNDKGKQGKVLAVFPKEEKLIVEGMNVKKKHSRPRQEGKKGELVLKSLPFAASRVMIVCPKCGAATRVGIKVTAEQKYRICKKCGSEI